MSSQSGYGPGMIVSGLIACVVALACVFVMSLVLPFPWGLSETMVATGIAAALIEFDVRALESIVGAVELFPALPQVARHAVKRLHEHADLVQHGLDDQQLRGFGRTDRTSGEAVAASGTAPSQVACDEAETVSA